MQNINNKSRSTSLVLIANVLGIKGGSNPNLSYADNRFCKIGIL